MNKKTLKVIKPFFVMETGDTFDLTENGDYMSSYVNDFNQSDDTDDIVSHYESNYTISKKFAESLIEQGYLEPEVQENSNFVNVFDEIDRLISTYTEDLSNIDETAPACLNVEKETVLRNMIKVLNHLNSLKK